MSTFLPKGFGEALRAIDPKKLDQQIMNGGQHAKYLPEGDHLVKVVGVDRNDLENNRLKLRWADAEGRECRETITLIYTDKTTGRPGLAFRFAELMGALIPSTEAYTALLAELDAGKTEALDLMIGMSCTVTVKRSPGYGFAEAVGGKYVLTDSVSGQKFSGSTIDEVKAIAEAAGAKRGFLNIERHVASPEHTRANIAMMTQGILAAQKPVAFPFKVAGGASSV